MKAVLPYSYVIRYLPKNRKKEIYGTYVDHIEFEMPEVSSGDVSLAVEWTSFDGLNRPHARRVVQWDGNLYIPADTYQGIEVKAASIPRSALDRVTDVDFFQRLYGINKGHHRSDAILDVWSGNPARMIMPKSAEIRMTDRLPEREFAEREFKRLVSIDGEVYKRVSRVALQLIHAEDGGYLYSSVEPSMTGFFERYTSYGQPEFWQRLNLPLTMVEERDRFLHPHLRPENSEKYADLVGDIAEMAVALEIEAGGQDHIVLVGGHDQRSREGVKCRSPQHASRSHAWLETLGRIETGQYPVQANGAIERLHFCFPKRMDVFAREEILDADVAPRQPVTERTCRL